MEEEEKSEIVKPAMDSSIANNVNLGKSSEPKKGLLDDYADGLPRQSDQDQQVDKWRKLYFKHVQFIQDAFKVQVKAKSKLIQLPTIKGYSLTKNEQTYAPQQYISVDYSTLARRVKVRCPYLKDNLLSIIDVMELFLATKGKNSPINAVTRKFLKEFSKYFYKCLSKKQDAFDNKDCLTIYRLFYGFNAMLNDVTKMRNGSFFKGNGYVPWINMCKKTLKNLKELATKIQSTQKDKSIVQSLDEITENSLKFVSNARVFMSYAYYNGEFKHPVTETRLKPLKDDKTFPKYKQTLLGAFSTTSTAFSKQAHQRHYNAKGKSPSIAPFQEEMNEGEGGDDFFNERQDWLKSDKKAQARLNRKFPRYFKNNSNDSETKDPQIDVNNQMPFNQEGARLKLFKKDRFGGDTLDLQVEDMPQLLAGMKSELEVEMSLNMPSGLSDEVRKAFGENNKGTAKFLRHISKDFLVFYTALAKIEEDVLFIKKHFSEGLLVKLGEKGVDLPRVQAILRKRMVRIQIAYNKAYSYMYRTQNVLYDYILDKETTDKSEWESNVLSAKIIWDGDLVHGEKENEAQPSKTIPSHIAETIDLLDDLLISNGVDINEEIKKVIDADKNNDSKNQSSDDEEKTNNTPNISDTQAWMEKFKGNSGSGNYNTPQLLSIDVAPPAYAGNDNNNEELKCNILPSAPTPFMQPTEESARVRDNFVVDRSVKGDEANEGALKWLWYGFCALSILDMFVFVGIFVYLIIVMEAAILPMIGLMACVCLFLLLLVGYDKACDYFSNKLPGNDNPYAISSVFQPRQVNYLNKNNIQQETVPLLTTTPHQTQQRESKHSKAEAQGNTPQDGTVTVAVYN